MKNDTELEVQMANLHLTCDQCKKQFPAAWAIEGKNGAKEIGFISFCSTKCEEAFNKSHVPSSGR